MILEADVETPQETPAAPSEEAIRLRSQEIWEHEGRPEGQAQDHWQRAKAELEAEMKRLSTRVQPRADDQTVPSASAREEIIRSPGKNNTILARLNPLSIKSGQRPKPNSPAPSIISADFALCGTVESAGDIHLDGRVEGAVSSVGLVVGERADVRGDIVADDVIVHGRVQGTIQARKLLLCATSRVEGDVIYEMLAVEEGAILDGEFRHLGQIDAAAETWQAELMKDDAEAGATPEKVPFDQAAA